jgi:hypothetical protein
MIRSFDIFDTILGRRCGLPINLFQQVERETGFLDFVSHRLTAEGALQQRRVSYNLSDIYHEFAAQQGIPKTVRDRLEESEFQAELRNAFLIQDNYHKVRHGDILISDMYLDYNQIRSLLRAAGFDRDCQIYVSNGGKADGSIWPTIKAKYEIEEHIGDNPQSDVATPRTFGIPTQIVTNTDLNWYETNWSALLPAPLLFQMRAARLSCPYPYEWIESYLWRLQCNVNFPLLYAASWALCSYMSENNLVKALFATRDGHNLRRVFHALFPEMPAYDIWTSRPALTNGSDEYFKYLNKHYTPDAVYVELDSSCQTKVACLPKLDSGVHHLFVVYHLTQMPESVVPEGYSFAAIATQRKPDPGICVVIERLNRDLTPRIADIKNNKPIYEDRIYPPKLVNPCEEALNCLLQDLPRTSVDPEKVVKQSLEFMVPHVDRLSAAFYGKTYYGEMK